MNRIIGREKQIELLKNALISDKSELIAIYGRRRVGKTFLIRETYAKEIILEISGIPDGSLNDQLINFYNEISKKFKKFLKKEPLKNWMEAFNMLGEYIDSLKSTKKVVFIDEFPWMYTHKSKFVQMFGHFWNSYCAKRNDLVVVICGSSASFMVNKVINDRKGLHNRISIPIRLLPFNLYETELFLKSKKVHLDRYAYLQLYMAIGGIPHYLDKIQQGDSVPVAIDRLCFQQDGILVNEFNQIFVSLFVTFQ
jgi:AAA+ ATPase superfamily predicted ATPase